MNNHKKLARMYFAEGFKILAQANASGPNVVIEPIEPLIQKAVDILKKRNSNYFDGVSKIKVDSGSNAFGFVQSGKDKDPTVLNINMNKIKNSTSEEEALYQTVMTIAHEAAHAKSFNEQQGFVGGESPAESEERDIALWLKNNPNLFKV